MKSSLILTVALASVLAGPALADVRLPSVLGDHMVLQRDIQPRIWGWASPGEKITVTLGAQTAQTTADEKGDWQVRLAPLQASSQPIELTVAGKNTLKVTDILVGDVWVCSGQSNMEWPLSKATNGDEEVKQAAVPGLRLFDIPRRSATQPVKDVACKWTPSTPETAAKFSAVGYFFGRELATDVKVPVGLIQTALGGTAIQSWTPLAACLADPDLDPAGVQKAFDDYAKLKAELPARLAQWQATTQRAASGPATGPASRAAVPARPGLPTAPGNFYANMYNAMIAPLTGLPIKGVIWYQGEWNTRGPRDYDKLQAGMVRSWRAAWGQGDFPFLYVQLPPYLKNATEPGGIGAMAALREGQRLALARIPNAAMIVTIDLGGTDTLHPPNKQPVGHRLALAAKALACGQDVVYSGPLFESMTVEAGKLRLRFKHVGGGLAATGDKLEGFALADQKLQYVWAEAVIDGDTVVVSSPKIAAPAAVQYAVGNSPPGNLVNKAGLPASPFVAGEEGLRKKP